MNVPKNKPEGKFMKLTNKDHEGILKFLDKAKDRVMPSANTTTLFGTEGDWRLDQQSSLARAKGYNLQIQRNNNIKGLKGPTSAVMVHVSSYGIDSKKIDSAKIQEALREALDSNPPQRYITYQAEIVETEDEFIEAEKIASGLAKKRQADDEQVQKDYLKKKDNKAKKNKKKKKGEEDESDDEDAPEKPRQEKDDEEDNEEAPRKPRKKKDGEDIGKPHNKPTKKDKEDVGKPHKKPAKKDEEETKDDWPGRNPVRRRSDEEDEENVKKPKKKTGDDDSGVIKIKPGRGGGSKNLKSKL